MKKCATSRQKNSLRIIWKNKSSACKGKRVRISKGSLVGISPFISKAQPQFLEQTRSCSIDSLKNEGEIDLEDMKATNNIKSWEEEYDAFVYWGRKNSLGDEDEVMEDGTTWEEKFALDIVIEIIDFTVSLESKRDLTSLAQ